MDSKIINGIKLAKIHEEELKEKIEKLGGIPHVVSFFNPEDQPSRIFTRLKQNKAKELGIVFDPIEVNPAVTVEILARLVEGFNRDSEVQGIMFQLPLPEHLSLQKDYLINLIKSDKDVDGLTGRSFLPATIKGVLSIMENEKLDLNTSTFAVIGSEGSMGQAMVKALKDKDCKVIEIDQKNPDSKLEDAVGADVVISCVGKHGLILPQHLKEEAMLIDVGLGDFDPSCFEKVSRYTPEKGGVGPMTVISLMENVVEAYLRHSGLDPESIT